MGTADVTMRQQASTQHGLVTLGQATEAGLSRSQVKRRVASGDLDRRHRAVYLAVGAPPSAEQQLLAAVLGGGDGAVASHRSAAWLWDLPGASSEPPEITVTDRRRPELTGVVAHQRFALDPIDLDCVRGIPVTAAARTLLDLGVVLRFATWEAAVEQALLRGLVTIVQLRDVHRRLGGRGRPGSAAMRAFLEERGASTPAAESPLEVAVLRLLRSHGLPRPARQHWVRTPRVGMVRVDLAYPGEKVGIEADGRIWHSGRGDFQRDRARGNALVDMGWRILRFTWDDVRNRPEQLVTDVRRALAA